jgi:hypothetical protein
VYSDVGCGGQEVNRATQHAQKTAGARVVVKYSNMQSSSAPLNVKVKSLLLTQFTQESIIMASTSPQPILVDHIATPTALSTLVQSFTGLPNYPAPLYLSTNLHSLVVYVASLHTVNVISFTFLVEALRYGEDSASSFKDFLEASPTIKVFFDARMAAKTLYDRCGITLANNVRFR